MQDIISLSVSSGVADERHRADATQNLANENLTLASLQALHQDGIGDFKNAGRVLGKSELEQGDDPASQGRILQWLFPLDHTEEVSG